MLVWASVRQTYHGGTMRQSRATHLMEFGKQTKGRLMKRLDKM